MILDKWIKPKLEKVLSRVVFKYGLGLTYDERVNIIIKSLSVYSFVLNVAMLLFLIYLFSNIIFKSVGFEKTIIILLVVIMVNLMNNDKL